MLLVPAMIDYISDIAPRGKGKLFQKHANLPVFLGTIFGAPLGGILFEFGINNPLKNGTAPRPVWIWVILGTAGFIAWIGFLIINRLTASKIRSSENPD